MDDRHAQPHEQAVNFWREVAREARTDDRVAHQHIWEEVARKTSNGSQKAHVRGTALACDTGFRLGSRHRTGGGAQEPASFAPISAIQRSE